MTLDPYDRIETDPWGLISDALACAARQEPCPQDLQDAVSIVAASLTSQVLVMNGATREQCEKLFVDRDWSVELGWRSGEMSIAINWLDGDEQPTEVLSGA